MVTQIKRQLYFKDLMISFISISRWFCFWPPDNEKYRRVYMFYSMLMIIFTVGIYYFCETINMISVLENWEEVTIDINLFMIHNVYNVKIYYLITKNAELKRLVKIMDDEIFKSQNAQEYSIGTKEMLVCKRNLLIQMMVGIVTIIFMILPPLIYKNGQLPVNTWFPYNIHESPFYEIIYVYQSICIPIHCFTIFSTDGIYMMLMVYTCGQLDITNFILRNLRKCSENNVQTGTFKDVSRQVEKLLIQCIRRHQHIIR